MKSLYLPLQHHPSLKNSLHFDHFVGQNLVGVDLDLFDHLPALIDLADFVFLVFDYLSYSLLVHRLLLSLID